MSAQPSEMETDVSTKPVVATKKPRFKQKPRNGNSRAKNDDAFRAKIGKKVDADYRLVRSAKFTSNLPNDLSSLNLKLPLAFKSRPVLPLVKRLPFSTIGIGATVSELFFRFNESFRQSGCSIYSLYRVALSQLDLQRQVSVEGGSSVYPYESLFVTMDHDRRDLTKAHPDNFKLIVFIIETFGRFKHNGAEFISVIPEHLWKKPFFVTFSDLSRIVTWLADASPDDQAARRDYFANNPLPGAVVDEESWVLANPHDYWDEEFTLRDLREDFVRVTRLLEGMKTKFEQVTDRVTFAGSGKASCLISVRAPQIAVPFTTRDIVFEEVEVDEPVAGNSRSKNQKRRKVIQRRRVEEPNETIHEPRPMASTEQFWYASEPIEELEASLGILTLSGCTTEQLERSVQVFRVRSQFNSAVRITESWTAVFDEAIPRISRT